MGFNKYTSVSVTTSTAVAVCPSDTVMTVIGATIANTSANLATVNLSVGGCSILKGALLSEGSAIIPIGGEQKVVLVSGDSLVVESTETVDVHVSVLEQAV